MLLPLLGVCAVVGPFQGPEWEPVWSLLSEDHSCRDLRCCGNLLVLCLFLIWQIRHYWHQLTRTHSSMKKVIKVPPQKRAVPSTRHDTCFGLISKLLFSRGKFRGLGAHGQQQAQKRSWEYWRSLQESWTQYLLSWQHPCQCPPWDFHTPSEPIFGTTSFTSTCMLPHHSSWDVWQAPWCLSDEHTHRICKPWFPDLDYRMYYKMEQSLVHSQEELVPLEPVVSMRSHPTSMTSLSNLPSSQRLQFCSTESLPFPSNQQVAIPTWKSWDYPPEAGAPGRENQILGREDIRKTQAPMWVNQRENSGEDAWEIQTSGKQLQIHFGMENNAETKVLEWGNQRLVIGKTDGEILTLGWENQDQMEVKNRPKIQELGRRNQREAEGENPPITQKYIVENQDQLRCRIDAETQTPEWGNQDKSRNEDAVETQAFEKNKKEAREEDEGETRAQELGKWGQTGSENCEEFQLQGWGKQDQIRGDIGTEIQAEERRNKDQVGGENAVQTQISGREKLGEIKKDNVEIQMLGWGKQECVESEHVIEIQTPGREKQDKGVRKKAGTTQASRGEIQKQLRHELQLMSGSQSLRRGEGAEESQISRRKNLKEIREEDWVVVQVLWWEDQRPLASKIEREFEIPCWGNQDQTRGEYRAKTQALEKGNQRKDRGEDGRNTLAPEAENAGQLRGNTHVDTHPPARRNQGQFGDETTDTQVAGKGNLKGVKGKDGKEIQKLGEEHQGQLSNEINGKIHMQKWKDQEHIRGKDDANTQVPVAENWGELTHKIDGETHSSEWKKEEQAGGENDTEIQTSDNKNQSKAGGKDVTETWAPGEENQSQLRGVTDRKTHLSEWKNLEPMGSEVGTEMQAPEKRNQREPGGEDGTETHRPERENLGQLDSETGESHSLERRNWEQTGGKNDAEYQTLEKRNKREVRSANGRKIQRLLKSKVNEKTCSSEWKNQEQIGGEDGAEIQIQVKRDLRRTTGGDGKETHAPGGDYQGQLRCQINGETPMQGQGHQNKGRDEDTAEIWEIGSQRKCRAEDAGGPGVPRGGNKDQVRGKGAAKDNLQVDCSGSERPPALTGSGYGAIEQKQAVVPAPCPERKPLPSLGELVLLTSGEGEHLTSQNTDPARKHRVGISPTFQQAPPKPKRNRQRNKRVALGKTCLALQLQNPQSPAASLHLPSSCPSVSCGQAPQAATALVGAPTALAVLPKWPVLKKSQRLLLESLMRRKIAHLKWGLPQRILESHSLFNFLGSCPLPFAGVYFPGLYTTCELQWQKERLCEAQGSRPGLKSPEKSQKFQPPERKSSKLSRTLEKCGPWGSEPMCISIHPKKPRRVRPPGGSRERQAVQEEAPPTAKLAAPRNPRPAAKSRSWCGQERVQEPSSKNSTGRKMVRLGISQMAERAPSSVRTSYSRAGHNHWRKESTSQEASMPPRFKCQQPPHWRSGGLEPVEGRGAGQQLSSCSTDTSSFKGSLHLAAGRLSMTLLNKMSWSPHLAKAQHSAPNLSLRGSDPTLLPKVVDSYISEDTNEVHTSFKRDLQPPGHCCAGVALSKAESLQGEGEPENPNGAPQNPAVSKKFGFMKYLRCFLLWHCVRK